MESLVARRKRTISSTTTTTLNPPRISLENLPREVQLEIYCRLSRKELSQAMCVSKLWRELIILNCLPFIAPLALNYFGLLIRLDSETNYQRSSGLSMVFNEFEDDCPSFGSYPLLRRCSRIMECKITSQMLLDCCNGLLLFCHRDGKADILSNELYYYYVINPITKQCIAFLKPSPKTARFMYASLAYDPSESSYFKIVQFQGSRQLNIFDAQKGDWMTLNSKLPQEVTRATWERKSVYNRGALYRLSNSGHVVKFLLESQVTVGDQVVAINLPGTYSPKNKCTIGIRNRKIFFASIFEMSLLIWELQDSFDGREYTHNWSLSHRVEYRTLDAINCAGQVLAIHPSLEIVLLKGKPYVFCSHYSINKMTFKQYSTPIHGWATAFPILECPVPFTCCLKKTNTGTFQRLTLSKISRRKDKSVHDVIISACTHPETSIKLIDGLKR